MSDARLQSAPAQRNRAAILDVLRGALPPEGLVLEIASGTGEHVAHFAAALPALRFQPSDPMPDRRASIDAWCEGLANVLPAITLDATAMPWPLARAEAMFCANMIHIAPWSACEGLFAGGGALLGEGAPLILYGPYRRAGRHTSQGNIDFDASLRARNPDWGIRDLEEVAALAARSGFAAPGIVEMPANNLTLIFRRKG